MRGTYTRGSIRLRDDTWGGSVREPLRDLMLAIAAYVVLATIAACVMLAAGASV